MCHHQPADIGETLKCHLELQAVSIGYKGRVAADNDHQMLFVAQLIHPQVILKLILIYFRILADYIQVIKYLFRRNLRNISDKFRNENKSFLHAPIIKS